MEALAAQAGQYSPAARTNLLVAIADKVRLIEQMPEMYPVAPLRPLLRRCVVSATVSLYYRVQPVAIEIVGVVDARRDPDALALPG
ncbi:hypothetical protein A0257_04695 [Hymenobacter psoromatis]|nr:hypothetical protein A0257_04695 [Hymenobacter psoromatis]